MWSVIRDAKEIGMFSQIFSQQFKLELPIHIDFPLMDIISTQRKWQNFKNLPTGTFIVHDMVKHFNAGQNLHFFSHSSMSDLAFRFQHHFILIWAVLCSSWTFFHPHVDSWHLLCGKTCQKYSVLKFTVCELSKAIKGKLWPVSNLWLGASGA